MHNKFCLYIPIEKVLCTHITTSCFLAPMHKYLWLRYIHTGVYTFCVKSTHYLFIYARIIYVVKVALLLDKCCKGSLTAEFPITLTTFDYLCFHFPFLSTYIFEYADFQLFNFSDMKFKKFITCYLKHCS